MKVTLNMGTVDLGHTYMQWVAKDLGNRDKAAPNRNYEV